jgi:hypothetical protein
MNLPIFDRFQRIAADAKSAPASPLKAQQPPAHIIDHSTDFISYSSRCSGAHTAPGCSIYSPSKGSVRPAHRPSRIAWINHVLFSHIGSHRTGDPICKKHSNSSASFLLAQCFRLASPQILSARALAPLRGLVQLLSWMATLPQAPLSAQQAVRFVTMCGCAAANPAQYVKIQIAACGEAPRTRLFV